MNLWQVVPELLLKKQFLADFADTLHSHTGWSDRYKRVAIVEPVCHFTVTDGTAGSCTPIESEPNIGTRFAAALDTEWDETDLQLCDFGKKYILINDLDPLMPRMKRFRWKEHALDGVIHYHIGYDALSGQDVATFVRLTRILTRLHGLKKFYAVVLSQSPDSIWNEAPEKETQYADLVHFIQTGAARLVGGLFEIGSTSEVTRNALKIAVQSV